MKGAGRSGLAIKAKKSQLSSRTRRRRDPGPTYHDVGDRIFKRRETWVLALPRLKVGVGRDDRNGAWYQLIVARGAFLQLVAELRVVERPAQAARDVLEPQHVQVVAVHAGDAVRQYDHAIVVVERREGGVEHAGIGIDPHQAD